MKFSLIITAVIIPIFPSHLANIKMVMAMGAESDQAIVKKVPLHLSKQSIHYANKTVDLPSNET